MSLAIVTGSSAGLGFNAALGLAREGFNRVVVTSRSIERATDAARILHRRFANAEFIPYSLELGDLEKVKLFADKVTAEEGPWNLLLNNAGAKIERPVKKTTQGFEWHYGVNHLAHFALTSWLKNSAAKDARVVANASIVARIGESKWWSDALSASTTAQYAASKLANLCFALELNRRSSLIACAAHPGFARAEPYGSKLVRVNEYLFAQSAKAGSLPLIEAAKSTTPAGSYLAPSVLEMWGKPKLVLPPASASEANQKLIFEVSESQLGFRF